MSLLIKSANSIQKTLVYAQYRINDQLFQGKIYRKNTEEKSGENLDNQQLQG